MDCSRIFFVSSIGQKNSMKLIDFQIIRVVLRKVRTEHTEFSLLTLATTSLTKAKVRKPAHTARRRRLKHALNKITRRIAFRVFIGLWRTSMPDGPDSRSVAFTRKHTQNYVQTLILGFVLAGALMLDFDINPNKTKNIFFSEHTLSI